MMLPVLNLVHWKRNAIAIPKGCYDYVYIGWILGVMICYDFLRFGTSCCVRLFFERRRCWTNRSVPDWLSQSSQSGQSSWRMLGISPAWMKTTTKLELMLKPVFLDWVVENTYLKNQTTYRYWYLISSFGDCSLAKVCEDDGYADYAANLAELSYDDQQPCEGYEALYALTVLDDDASTLPGKPMTFRHQEGQETHETKVAWCPQKMVFKFSLLCWLS